MDPNPVEVEEILLGGGCFWCIEAGYQLLDGVLEVQSGYAGGHVDHPGYRQVCSGTTGHAEVVRVRFDPARITLRELLTVFFLLHDPTQLNRQGNDIGTQYRSVIFADNDGQAATAREMIAALDASGLYRTPVVTAVEGRVAFFPAEPEHDDYYRRNSRQGYCRVVIDPKLDKVRAYLERRR